jgi:hypothetical protein
VQLVSAMSDERITIGINLDIFYPKIGLLKLGGWKFFSAWKDTNTAFRNLALSVKCAGILGLC